MSLVPILLTIACGVDREEYESLKAERDELNTRVEALQSETVRYIEKRSKLEAAVQRLKTQLAAERKELEAQLAAEREELQELKLENGEIMEERAELKAELLKIQEATLDAGYRRFLSSFLRQVEKRKWESAREVFAELTRKWPDSPFKVEVHQILDNLTELRDSVLHLRELNGDRRLSGIVVYGLVRNISSESMKGVQVLAILKNDEDEFLSSAVSSIDVDPLMEGQSSPFSVELPHWALGGGHFEVEFQQKDGSKLPTFRDGQED